MTYKEYIMKLEYETRKRLNEREIKYAYTCSMCFLRLTLIIS